MSNFMDEIEQEIGAHVIPKYISEDHCYAGPFRRCSKDDAASTVSVSSDSTYASGTGSSDDIISISSTIVSQSTSNSSPNRPPTADQMLNYTYRSHMNVSKLALWCVEFNQFLSNNQPSVFAAVGGTKISIFECLANGKFKFVLCFADPDANENFYTCCWSLDKSLKHSLIIAGGERGIIRIILADQPNAEPYHLNGHGNAINQVTVSSRKPFLMASASKDLSFRLWNIHTMVCIANIHSVNSHRDQVITVAFNWNCTKLVSGGMDHKLAIWNLESNEMVSAIEASRTFDKTQCKKDFKTIYEPFPIFTTREIHTNYIDCVRWFGNFVLSKACKDEKLMCWKLDTLNDHRTVAGRQTKFSIVQEFQLPNCDYYFIRFALDQKMNVMAVGSITGDIRVWYLQESDPDKIKHIDLKHKKCNSVVRHVTFSRCGRIMIYCCDDGTIWQWERN